MSDSIPSPVLFLTAPGPSESRQATLQARCARLWWLLAALIFGCLATHHGSLLNLSVPALTFIVAVVFARVSPRNFIRLMIITFVFSPMVRRLADGFGGGFTDPSPILLTAYLVPIAGVVAIRFSHLFKRHYLPFSLALLGIGYGLMIGLVSIPEHMPVLVSALRWVAPVLGGLYLLDQRLKGRSDLVDVLTSSIRWAALGSAAYGLVQVPVLPSWDLLWLKAMLEAGLASGGLPVPFGFRAFGPLNSTGVAAQFWSLGFLFWVFGPQRLRLVALTTLAAALLLTLVRTEWFCLPVAVMAGLLLLKQGRREVFVSLAACAGVLVLVSGFLAAAVPELSNNIGDRLGSVSSGKGDESLGSRTMAINAAIGMVKTMPFGTGLGFLDGAQYARTIMANPAGATGPDLGIVGIVFDLGYLGSAIYLCGIGGICLFAWRLRPAQCSDATVVKTAVLLTLLHVWSNDPFPAPTALILWLVGAIACGQAGLLQQPVPHAGHPRRFTGRTEKANLAV